jgi:DNA-binding transcriptional LysR family regulator
MTFLQIMQQTSIDLDCLRSFVAVADRLAFHEAATMLRISASTLTRRIQRLEAALDTPLLERSTRQVTPTAEGRLLLPLARTAIAAVDAAVDAVRTASRARAGHLVLACVPTMTHQFLPAIIRAFQARWPQTPVRVVECSADAVLQAVQDGSADFGCGFLAGAGIDASLMFEPMLTDPYCLILPSDHVLAALPEVPWVTLKPHKVITAGHHSRNMQVLDAALQGVDWRPAAKYEIDHLTTSLGLVEAGLGIAIVPRSALAAQLPPGMAMRPLIEPRATRSIGLFRRRNGALPATARHFLNAARRTAAALRDRTD